MIQSEYFSGLSASIFLPNGDRVAVRKNPMSVMLRNEASHIFSPDEDGILRPRFYQDDIATRSPTKEKHLAAGTDKCL